jgi:hypothetical protein
MMDELILYFIAGVLSMAIAGTVWIIILLKTKTGQRLMEWAKQ